MRRRAQFDPYALLEALERNRVSYVIVGALARVVHGTGEVTRGLDIVPSLRDENLRRLSHAVEELNPSASIPVDSVPADEPLRVETPVGSLGVVKQPWGTRGYDDLRIRGNRENLGRGLRPQIASIVDLVRMLDASQRPEDVERLQRLRRLMELERVRSRRRGLQLER
jgi:hypothetical protein